MRGSIILLVTLVAAVAIPQFAAAQATQKGTTKTSDAASGQLPKLWYSEATKHEFRVEVVGDEFHAEWVNIPPAASKRGAYIHTECRRTGSKWVGTSKLNMLFPNPKAATGNDTKMCPLTVRFEVDSISPEKITGHSESIHAFDVDTCRVEQTKWGEFTWIPKK